IQLSPSCPFRLLHTCLTLRPARSYPRFWIRRPSSERRRDLNPPDQHAAQRTLCGPPTPSLRRPQLRFPSLLPTSAAGACSWPWPRAPTSAWLTSELAVRVTPWPAFAEERQGSLRLPDHPSAGAPGANTPPDA